MLTKFKCFEEPTRGLSTDVFHFTGWAFHRSSTFHREFHDSVISNYLLALSVCGKTILFHFSLRQAPMSTTGMPGGGPVRSHVGEPGPQCVGRMMGVGGGGWWGEVGKEERQELQEAASSEVRIRMAVTCLTRPREEWSRQTPDHTAWSEQVSCLSHPPMCNNCHPSQASLRLEVSSLRDWMCKPEFGA